MEKRRTSKTKIYAELRRSIITGQYRPGTRLDLEELATQFGTSLTPIREALQMLGQEGMVTIKPRSGYFVMHISLKQLRDLLELREILEVATVERAVDRLRDHQIDELERLHVKQQSEVNSSNFAEYMEANRTFHYALAEAAGNKALAEMLGQVHDRLAGFIVLCQAAGTRQMRHTRLLEALRSRDMIAAKETMLAEVHTTRDDVLDYVIREEGAYWLLGAKDSQAA